MMNDTRTLFLTLIVAATLWGCGNTASFQIGAPVLDSHFGEAVTRAKQMQIVNPEGVDVSDEGYSGKAAHSAIDRYESAAAKGAAPSSSSTPSADATAKNGK
jgi:hypothetical protein